MKISSVLYFMWCCPNCPTWCFTMQQQYYDCQWINYLSNNLWQVFESLHISRQHVMRWNNIQTNWLIFALWIGKVLLVDVLKWFSPHLYIIHVGMWSLSIILSTSIWIRKCMVDTPNSSTTNDWILSFGSNLVSLCH